MRKFAIGNWKMNGSLATLTELRSIQIGQASAGVTTVICPPFPLLQAAVQECQDTGVKIGAQTCHVAAKGAHTGDVSADILADVGARYVIVGHSERRVDHQENNETVRAQMSAAALAGLTPILCVGESQADRSRGGTLKVTGEQLKSSVPDDVINFILAYEPIWAVGTGITPKLTEIAEVHAFLATELLTILGDVCDIPILYGGSVKPENASAIFALPHVDGALVGGASLKAVDFCPIIVALGQSR
ncbi:MAG: triosephosphate isomerase [Paracoccaceae bacterium]|jgi:triosephosphate isomerase